METDTSRRYLVGTLVAAMLAVVGTLLPWVRKLPVATAEETPEGLGAIYTLEWVSGMETGFSFPADAFTLVPALLAVVAVAVVVIVHGDRNRIADGVLVATGSAILYVAGSASVQYYITERYAIEPGLLVVLVAGALLVVIGAQGFRGSLANRHDETVAT